MSEQCLLYDKVCTNCGECDMCDLDPNKMCNNCGSCLEESSGFRSLNVKKFIFGKNQKDKKKK